MAIAAAATLALLLSPMLLAQDEDEADPGADTTLVPQPAEMAPRAAHGLLLDVARAGKTWVAVGQRGIILISADATNWAQVATPVDTTLNRVRFVDDTHGWAVGYDGTILGTSDGARTWQLLGFDADWGRPYFDVLFFDAATGLLAGANGALKSTTDGGKTWTDVASDVLADTPNLYNIVSLGDGSLLIAGERGFLARSKDKGATWVQLKSPYTGSFFGAMASGGSGALIFGLRGNAFYAPDIAKAEPLSAKDLEAQRAFAADPTNATGNASPVTNVAGWTHLANDDTEPLFGATVGADGSMLLVGQNGRVMRADLAGDALQRIPTGLDINMNAGLRDGDALVTVGTSGINRVALK